MPKMTKKEAIIEQLTSIGFERVETKSTKYVALKRPETKKVFVGRKGGMRYGHNVSDSISISNPTACLAAMQKKYGR